MSQQPHRFLGQVMVVIAWLIILGLLTMFFSHWHDQKNNPNQAPKTYVASGGQNYVILKRNPLHQFVVDGHVNDQKVTFLVDTGATLVSIPENLAKTLHLKKGLPQKVHTANGVITVYGTTLKKLRIGDIVLSDVHATINPKSNMKAGLLGMSALRYFDITQRDGVLVLQRNSGK